MLRHEFPSPKTHLQIRILLFLYWMLKILLEIEDSSDQTPTFPVEGVEPSSVVCLIKNDIAKNHDSVPFYENMRMATVTEWNL